MGEGRKPRIKNAKRVTSRGRVFDSAVEAEFYEHLMKMKDNGEIIEFECQPSFELQPAFVKDGRKYNSIEYRGDFLVTYPDRTKAVIDVKGMETEIFQLKAKLFAFKYPNINLVIMKFYQRKAGTEFVEKSEWKRRKAEREKAKALKAKGEGDATKTNTRKGSARKGRRVQHGIQPSM